MGQRSTDVEESDSTSSSEAADTESMCDTLASQRWKRHIWVRKAFWLPLLLLAAACCIFLAPALEWSSTTRQAYSDLPSTHNMTTTAFYSKEQHTHSFKLEGIIFQKRRDVIIGGDVVTSELYSFSPALESNMKSKFIDPPDENFYYGLAPSGIWHNGEYVVVSRVWLAKMKHKLKPVPKFPNNTFVINWLFKQTFDQNMKAKDRGEIMQIPIPLTKRASAGIMDPRIFKIKGELFVIGQAATYIDYHFWRPHPIIWDLQRSIPIIPMPPETDQNRSEFHEKNWIPLIINDELHLFQNMDPMRLMKCDLKGKCNFVVDHGDIGGEVFDFDEFKVAFRGGTAFMEYQWPYFVCIAHGVIHKNVSGEDHRFYSSNLALLRVDPTIRFVYISGDIEFNKAIKKDIEGITYFGQVPIGNDFIFPTSMVLEDLNTIAIGAHVNDNVSVLLRLRGVQAILQEAIRVDMEEQDPNFTLRPWRVQEAVRGLLMRTL